MTRPIGIRASQVFSNDRLFALQSALQPIAITLIVTATLALVVGTVLALAGVIAWPDLQMGYGGQVYQIGMAVQIGLLLLMLSMCVYLPGALRVQRLELAHRRFHIGMEDVTRAYHAAHAADRAGMFQMKHEFDAVRERIAYLREHPDLGDLEPEILEVAAQMSQVSQELAHVYSDERVERARRFLVQRQQEIADFNARIDSAKQMTQELRQWVDHVDMEEDVARSQLDRLRLELTELMPQLAPYIGQDAPESTATSGQLSAPDLKSAPDLTGDAGFTTDGQNRVVDLPASRARSN